MTDTIAAIENPKPQCIVMPLRPEPGQFPNGMGLGLHFMLGNIIVLHGGLEELWFGWRYSKIFADAAAFTRYAHRPDTPFDAAGAGKTQRVRFWIEGWYRQAGDAVSTRLVLTDAEAAGRPLAEAIHLADPADRYTGYRGAVMDWMGACGMPFPAAARPRGLWPEILPLPALDVFGRGLEAYYRHTGYGGSGPVDPALLDQAVALAPGAYLTHDLRGWILYKNADYPAAEAAFRAALDINPTGAGAMAGLIWIAIVTGNALEAQAWTEAKAGICGACLAQAREKTARLLKKYAGR